MTVLFKKLNYKAPLDVFIINSPISFESELIEMSSICKVEKNIPLSGTTVEFVLCFATLQMQTETFIQQIYPHLSEDAVLWICYPKGTSKNYSCDFNRDTGWDSLAKICYEPVRMVAIDADWSALRFRNVSKIKKITRRESFAITKEAKQRTIQKGV